MAIVFMAVFFNQNLPLSVFPLPLYSSLLQKTRTNLIRVQQELKDREGLERELSHVKTWIHQSRELLLNPIADLDLLLQELEVSHLNVVAV